MNIEEFAKSLGQSDYFSLSPHQARIAKENGFVVVYGSSDDLMELDGAIYDEFGCYGGGIACLNPKGLLQIGDNCEDCPLFKAELAKCKTITAVWGADGYPWTYKTDIPHMEFDILEDGKPYCRGIVFDVKFLEDNVQ